MKQNIKFGTGVIIICLMIAMCITIADTEILAEYSVADYMSTVMIQIGLTAIGFFILVIVYQIGKIIRKSFDGETIDTYIRLKVMKFSSGAAERTWNTSLHVYKIFCLRF